MSEPDVVDLHPPTGFDGSDDQLITAGEAARRLGVTRQTVGDWAEQGLLTYHRVAGQGWRYYRAHEIDLTQQMQSLRRELDDTRRERDELRRRMTRIRSMASTS